MAKDLSQFLSLLKRKDWTANDGHPPNAETEQGYDLHCFGKTTGKLEGYNLAVYKHGLAESGESIHNQERNVVLCHKLCKLNMTSEIMGEKHQ